MSFEDKTLSSDEWHLLRAHLRLPGGSVGAVHVEHVPALGVTTLQKHTAMRLLGTGLLEPDLNPAA